MDKNNEGLLNLKQSIIRKFRDSQLNSSGIPPDKETFSGIGDNKTKLAEITDRMKSFETNLQQETNVRNERLDHLKHKYQACQDAITLVQKKLDDDLHRRDKLIETILEKVDIQLQSYKTKLEHFLQTRAMEIGQTLTELEQKEEQLQFAIDTTDVNSIRENLQVFATEQIKDIGSRIDNLWAKRNETEQEFKEQLSYWSEKTEDQALKEKNDIKEQMGKLNEEIISISDSQGDKSEKFQAKFRSKINELKTLLQKETSARQMADDEIVTALNEYTESIHKALSIVTDTI